MSEVDVRERREVWIGHQSAAAETHDGSEGPRNGEPAQAAEHIAFRSRVGSTRDGLCVERRNDSEVATVSERVTEAYSLPCRRVPGVSALGVAQVQLSSTTHSSLGRRRRQRNRKRWCIRRRGCLRSTSWWCTSLRRCRQLERAPMPTARAPRVCPDCRRRPKIRCRRMHRELRTWRVKRVRRTRAY
mgnify:CR=1 FL=1